jgi:heat shock protein HtpX
MANLYQNQSSNKSKSWALVVGFLVVIIMLGWGASWYFNSPAILIGAVIFSLVMNIGGFFFSHKVALKTAGAKEADESDYANLHNTVENMAITAGIEKPAVYIIEEPSPNAFATGRNEETACIAVTTGLLELLDKSELEGVIAHEVAHITNRDILLSSMVVVLVGFVTLLSDFFLRWSLFGGSQRDGRIGLIMTLVGIVLAILAPIAATLIQLAISRKREFLADASGVLLTRYPDGLANALQKIDAAVSRQPMQGANHATSHLYIENPFGGEDSESSFFDKLFMTHPPTSERVNALLNQQ